MTQPAEPQSVTPEQNATAPAIQAPVAQPVTVTETQPAAAFSLREFAAQQGFKVDDYTDDRSAAAAMLQQLQTARQFAAMQQRVPEQEPEPDTQSEPEWSEDGHFSSLWSVPKLDPRWQGMIELGQVVQDEKGRYVPAQGFEFMAANPMLSEMNAYEQARRQRVPEFLENPYRKTWDGIKEVADRRYLTREDFERMMSEREAARENQTSVASFEQKMAPLLYSDPTKVPEYGTPQFEQSLSTYGKQFFAAIEEAKTLLGEGVPQNRILALASRLAPPPVQQQTSAATPQQAAAVQPQGSFVDDALQKAAHRPSGTPSKPGDGQPYGPNAKADDIRAWIKQL